MSDSDTLWNLLKIAPAVVLLLVVFVGVFRGMGRDGDSTNNHAKGGGLSNWDHWMGGGR